MKGPPEVVIDGVLYVGIAMLTIVISEGRNITPDKLNIWSWVDYTIFFATILLSGGIALKTFRSESISRHRQEVRMEEAKKGGPNETEVTEITKKTVETETVTTDNKDGNGKNTDKEKENI